MAHACLHCSAYWDGMSAGLAGVKEKPRGLREPSIASSVSTNADKEHTETPQTLQEPAIPLKDADPEPTSDAIPVQSGRAEISTVQLKEPEDVQRGASSFAQDSRQKPAQHALPGAAHKWAQYESSSALSGQQYPDAKRLTTLQASSLPVQLADPRVMLCLMAPLCLLSAVAAQV